MPVVDRNAVSWTAAIGVLMRAGRVCRMLQCHDFCVLQQRSCPRCFYALFEGMPRKNVISWIAMISGGYDQNDVGYGKDEAHAKHLGMCQCARHIAWFADGQTAKLGYW
uniref:Uncharacterized protein n=1 Tax=Oryza rufipogon TaxID=4529 RepID=A0A0E0MTT1_ORYRU